MKKIIFFQHHHNGDLFVSKEYVRQIINDLPDFDVEYFHNNNPKTLLDLEISQRTFDVNSISKEVVYIEKPNHLFINTWLFVHPQYDRRGSINQSVMHRIFSDVFNKINQYFNVNLILKDKQNYIAKINYLKFDVTSIDKFIESNNRKKILLSNGKPMASQSFDNNMSNIVNNLAKKHSDIDFICTDKFETPQKNILFTDDLIPTAQDTAILNPWNKKRCDLNEISYLSKFCNIIVGKNSGPYIYCMTEENINDPKKTIIVFNKRGLDSLLAEINYKARYIYKKIDHKNFNEQLVTEIIEESLNE